MVVLRLTAHGQTQPQNSPHGWSAKTATHTCFDAEHEYGCWTIVTPPWTEGNNYETGFTQNSVDLPPCCTSSTVRCYFPEDFINCYPWPAEVAVRGDAPLLQPRTTRVRPHATQPPRSA